MNAEFKVGDFVNTIDFGVGVVVSAHNCHTLDTNFPLLVYFFGKRITLSYTLRGSYSYYSKKGTSDLHRILDSQKIRVTFEIS